MSCATAVPRVIAFHCLSLVLTLAACQDEPNPVEPAQEASEILLAEEASETSPWFWFNSGSNWGQAAGWELGSGVLTIEYDDPTTPASPDWTGTNTAEPDWDTNNFNLGGREARGGDLITISGPLASDPGESGSSTLIVHDLLVAADFETETAFGYAGRGDEVCVEVEQPSGWCSNDAPWVCVAVDESRHWEVDLSGVTCDNEPQNLVNLEPGLMVVADQVDAHGNHTSPHWTATTATSTRCVGFDDPWSTYPVTDAGDAAQPLAARLFDARGTELSDQILATPPVPRVLFDDGSGAMDVTDWVIPAGTHFTYSAEAGWALAVETELFTAAGTYTLSVASGDEQEYQLYSYSTCRTQYVAETEPYRCDRPADAVVSDEWRLRYAIDRSSTGDVIAIDGTIELTDWLRVRSANITLTACHEGDGLTVAPDVHLPRLMAVGAPRVTVDGLVLDGTRTGRPYRAHYDGGNWLAEDVTLSNNTVTCGTIGCAWFTGVSGSRIVDNLFEADGIRGGVHLQGTDWSGGIHVNRTDGTRIERNTVVTTAPNPSCPWCAGIRPRDGSGLVIADNEVLGPWVNSISTAELVDSRVEKNRLEGAENYGIAVSFNAFTDFSAVGNVFRQNRISGAGAAEVRARWACDNDFLANVLPGRRSDLAVIFEWSTGANLFLGRGNMVEDNGDFDCDGDGIADPNGIRGAKLVESGVHVGERVRDAVSGGGAH